MNYSTLTKWEGDTRVPKALNRFITKCDGQLLQIAKAFWLQSATWLIIATLTYLIHISHFRKRLSLPRPQGFTEKFANIRGLFLRRIRGTFEWYLHPTSTLIFEILVQSHRFLKAVRQLLVTTRMLRPAMSVFIVSEGCIYTFTRTRFQFYAVSRRVTFWERLDCKTVGFFSPKEPYALSLFSASFQTFCLTARAYLNTQKYGVFYSLEQGSRERSVRCPCF